MGGAGVSRRYFIAAVTATTGGDEAKHRGESAKCEE